MGAGVVREPQEYGSGGHRVRPCQNPGMLPWRRAIHEALYSPEGFYLRNEPAGHFRTSAQSRVFAEAVARVIEETDAVLGRPGVFEWVDMGAGEAALITNVMELVSADVRDRLKPVAVDLRPRPEGLDPRVEWRSTPPHGVTGLLTAFEWLDNVPLDVAVRTGEGLRLELVDSTGATEPGDPVRDPWPDTWWPDGDRVEIGRPRDLAWSRLVVNMERGTALAVDYGHLKDSRRPTLTGYAHGRQVSPVPDGECDITAHVAMDSVAAAGERAGATATSLMTQRDALRDMGFSAARPPITEASRDPRGYLRALSRTGELAELTDPAGLGAHWWLLQRVSC